MAQNGYYKIESIILPRPAVQLMREALQVYDTRGIVQLENVQRLKKMRQRLSGYGRGEIKYLNTEEDRNTAINLLHIVSDGSREPLKSRFRKLQGIFEKFGIQAINREKALEIVDNLSHESHRWYRRGFYRNVLLSKLYERTIIQSIEEKADLITMRAIDVFADFIIENMDIIDRIGNSSGSLNTMERHKRISAAMHTVFGMQRLNDSLTYLHEGLFAEDSKKAARSLTDQDPNSAGPMIAFLYRIHGLFLMSVHGEWNIKSLGRIKEYILRAEFKDDIDIMVSALNYVAHMGAFRHDPVAEHGRLELWREAIDVAQNFLITGKGGEYELEELEETRARVEQGKQILEDALRSYGGGHNPEIPESSGMDM